MTIAAPIQKVFAEWTDVENYPQWAMPVIERRKVSEGPVGTGTKFAAKDRWPGRTVDFDMEITQCEAATKFGARWSEPVLGT